jgi:hypothetical protein
MVLIKQLMRGNSFRDIRKINPFANGCNSLFVQAVMDGNVELANLILDKSLKPNPIQPFLCTKFYNERYRNLQLAENIASRINYDLFSERYFPLYHLRGRLNKTLRSMEALWEALYVPLINLIIWSGVIYLITKYT